MALEPITLSIESAQNVKGLKDDRLPLVYLIHTPQRLLRP